MSVCTALVLVGCTPDARQTPTVTATPARPLPSETTPPTSVVLPVRPQGDPLVIASDLDAPWSVLRVPDGGVLISERDTTDVRELLPDGSLRTAGTVEAAEPSGEGGLLGLAFLADAGAPGAQGWVYAYATAADGNQIQRMPLTGSAGGYGLGDPQLILDGIPKAGNHNGGRVAFGPDGMLYATVGDAGNASSAQDLNSLSGKILRMTPTGHAAPGNPFSNRVYSYGHRNPQGIAWDSRGQLWASEFGQNTWDELNRITPGANYGWPEVEGAAGSLAYADPMQQWPTEVASPSGMAIVNDTIFMAALRGERMWRISPSTGEMDEWFVGSFGRLRDVVSGPAGTLWFVSNNTDGRGDPTLGDDRLYQVQVAP
ncbi:MAG: glucose dehydrogenase [Cryobacterium sp.]|nr:glucose dehydrogenase [Cryobacterium sp.]